MISVLLEDEWTHILKSDSHVHKRQAVPSAQEGFIFDYTPWLLLLFVVVTSHNES
jgi:hypothetical protein